MLTTLRTTIMAPRREQCPERQCGTTAQRAPPEGQVGPRLPGPCPSSQSGTQNCPANPRRLVQSLPKFTLLVKWKSQVPGSRSHVHQRKPSLGLPSGWLVPQGLSGSAPNPPALQGCLSCTWHSRSKSSGPPLTSLLVSSSWPSLDMSLFYLD